MQINRRTLLGGFGASFAAPCIFTPGSAFATPAVNILKRVRLGADQTGDVYNPSMAILSNGRVVAGWINQHITRTAFVRFYTHAGDPLSGDIKLGNPAGPTAGVNASSVQPIGLDGGRCLVVFSAQAKNATIDGGDIFVQLFSSSYTPIGLPIAINEAKTGRQSSVMAVRLSNGNILVIWQTQGSTVDSINLFGRVIGTDGKPIAAQRHITGETTGAQVASSLTAIDNGQSIFTYYTTASSLTAPFTIYAQTLDKLGGRVGKRITVKTVPQAGRAFGSAGIFYFPQLGPIFTWFKEKTQASNASGSMPPAQDYATIFWRIGGHNYDVPVTLPFNASSLYFPIVTLSPDNNLLFTANSYDAAKQVYNMVGTLVSPVTNKVIAGPTITAMRPDMLQAYYAQSYYNVYNSYYTYYSYYYPNSYYSYYYYYRY